MYDEENLRSWLQARWATPEIEESVVGLFLRMKKAHTELVAIGAAIPVSEAMDEVMSDIRGQNRPEQIIWFVMWIAECFAGLVELEK